MKFYETTAEEYIVSKEKVNLHKECTMDLIAELKQELKGDETILIKGSRAQRMESVASALVENFRN